MIHKTKPSYPSFTSYLKQIIIILKYKFQEVRELWLKPKKP